MICRDSGPPDAKVMLIGDALGESDERTGVPFSGTSGALLKQMLSHCGVQFSECYATNVVNERPPSGKFSYFYDTKILEESLLKLRNKIMSIQPAVIIPLGKEALNAVCNKYNIGAYRGTWLSYRNIKVMPTYHPKFVMKQYSAHVIVELDIVKAISQEPEPIPPMIIGPTLQQVFKWISDAHKYSKRLAFDIETIDRTVRTISFATDCVKMMRAISIPFLRFPSSSMATVGDSVVKIGQSSGSLNCYWSPDDEVRVLDKIQELLDSGIEIVGQNSISFDAPFIEREFGLTIKNHYMDTMHAFHCVYSELPKNLDFLCSIYTNYANYWSEKETANDISEWTYNNMDSISTLEASYKIEKELNETFECKER